MVKWFPLNRAVQEFDAYKFPIRPTCEFCNAYNVPEFADVAVQSQSFHQIFTLALPCSDGYLAAEVDVPNKSLLSASVNRVIHP
jgi:hypothetical protein